MIKHNNRRTFDTYLIRHGQTLDGNNGNVQGSNNGPNNQVLPEGLTEVRENVITKLIPNLQGVDPNNIYIYVAGQQRCLDTCGVLMEELMRNNLLKMENVVFDDRLNGRSYGDLEGLSESKIKSAPYIITHPAKSLSYIKAQLGFENATRIEPKSDYETRLLTFISDVCNRHGIDHREEQERNASRPQKDVVIVVGTSDWPRAVKKSEMLHLFHRFGHETPLDRKAKKIPVPAQGDVMKFDLGLPYQDENGKVYPLWQMNTEKAKLREELNLQREN